jgi:hypothetical protein
MVRKRIHYGGRQVLTDEEAQARLKRHVEVEFLGHGKSKGDAAEAMGIPQTTLSDMLSGRRPITGSVADAINIERVMIYREKTHA